MNARHCYGDWCRHSENGMVGVIVDEILYKSEYTKDVLGLRTTYVVQWSDGTKQSTRYYETDLISEYEYFQLVDPSRCKNDLPVNELRECYFINQMWRFPPLPPIPQDNEDLF